MTITIRPAKGVPAALLESARTHAAFALGRFGSHVRSVTVRLADTNGPRGGVDQACTITIRVATCRQPIVVTDTDADIRVALGRALGRAARSVARVVGRDVAWRTAPRGSTGRLGRAWRRSSRRASRGMG